VIALTEKNVPFERIDVDLANRPDWFVAVSPLGKVPLLKAGEEVLFESAAIVEYLDDTQTPRLHPADPLERARHRAWIEFGSTVLADIWGFYTVPGEAEFTAKAAALRSKFERLETALGDGPYFSGEGFTLVDAAFGPVFRYFDIFDRIGDFGILPGLPKVDSWRKALSARPSVAGAVAPDYPARLQAFIAARAGHLARSIPLAA
jgi:glutathione S-transferase